MESPKAQHKLFPFRRAHREGGLLGCFMVPRGLSKCCLVPTSPSTSSSTSSCKENFFDPVVTDPMLITTTISTLSDSTHILPTRSHSDNNRLSSATAPLLDPDAEATEESFVFSPLAPSSAPLNSPSFRTLSDPLLSTFSYSCAPVTDNPNQGAPLRSTPGSKFGGRPHPLPPLAASPFQFKSGNAAKPVWLPLPAPELPAARPPSRSSSSVVGGEDVGSWSIRRGKVAPVGALPLPPPWVATKLLPGLESFDFDDLVRGTRDFAAESCMEKGEFGAVYRAWVTNSAPVSSRRELAVVRLNVDERQSLKDWRTDVQMLSQLSDSNICVIKGYCAHEGFSSERLLVFEQSPNGNLHDYLCGSRSNTQLDWSARISIVLGAARGLLYLHDRAPFQIVYREFKSSSVLLDKDYTPRLAGYGLAVTTSSPSAKKSSSFTSVMKRSHAHAKSNVWSFGLVLVEILTGKYCRDSIFQCDEKNFVRWAMPFLKDESRLMLILDPRVKGSFKCSVSGAFKLAELAVRCFKKEVQRPSMARVVDSLKSIKENFDDHRLEFSSKALLLPSTFGGISFRDSESRSKVVDRKFLLMADSGSSSITSTSSSTTSTSSSEDEDDSTAVKSFDDFETARAHSPKVC